MAAKKPRLTQKERRALLSAVAFITAGEWDENVGDDPGFTQDDIESAAKKIAAGLKSPKQA